MISIEKSFNQFRLRKKERSKKKNTNFNQKIRILVGVKKMNENPYGSLRPSGVWPHLSCPRRRWCRPSSGPRPYNPATAAIYGKFNFLIYSPFALDAFRC